MQRRFLLCYFSFLICRLLGILSLVSLQACDNSSLSLTFKNSEGVTLSEAISVIKDFLGIRELAEQVVVKSEQRNPKEKVVRASSPEINQKGYANKDTISIQRFSNGISKFSKSPSNAIPFIEDGPFKNNKSKSLRMNSVNGKFMSNRMVEVEAAKPQPEDLGFQMSNEQRMQIKEEAELEAQEWLNKMVGQRRLVAEAFEIQMQKKRDESVEISDAEAYALAVSRFTESHVAQVLLTCGTLGDSRV